MLHGFDYAWWSDWHEQQEGIARDFGPELFGIGFVFRNLELLLAGQLPAGLFAVGGAAANSAAVVDPLVLALGAAYLVTGTIQEGGDRLRIVVSLEDVANPQRAWSRRRPDVSRRRGRSGRLRCRPGTALPRAAASSTTSSATRGPR